MKFTDTGLWLLKEDQIVTIGLSEKGQDDLGEVGFVSLGEDSDLTEESILLSVEAAKAVLSIASPLAGSVDSYHKELEDQPELLNSTNPNENWIVKLSNVSEEAYSALSDN